MESGKPSLQKHATKHHQYIKQGTLVKNTRLKFRTKHKTSNSVEQDVSHESYQIISYNKFNITWPFNG